MPIFEFECVHFETPIVWTARTTQPESCPHGQRSFRRLYTFGGIKKGWSGGYNPTIGGYAANEHQVNEALKAASESASEASGTEHRYKSIDPRELAAMKPKKPEPKPINVDKLAAEISRVVG